MENFEKRVGINRSDNSARTYRSPYKHLAGFLSKRYKLSDIPFAALNRSIIDKFDLYLRIERRLTPRSVLLNMSRLHTAVNKDLAAVCGIDRKLTFHKTRHNFGTHIMLSLGVPLETFIRKMGHKRIVKTQIYAHVTDKKVDEDTKQLRQLSAGCKLELYEESQNANNR